MRICIIHGYNASSLETWFPWFKEQALQLGYSVVIPQMPNKLIPSRREWVSEISKAVGRSISDTVLIGHSLGGTAILHYLSEASAKTKFKAVILVAPFIHDSDLVELMNFKYKKIDWQKIKKRAEKFIVIHSKDDAFVPIKEAEYITKKLKAEFVSVKGFYHFCETDGIKVAPPVLNALESVMLK